MSGRIGKMLYEQMLLLLLAEQQSDDVEEIRANISAIISTLHMFDFRSNERIKELLYKKLELVIEKSENKPAEIRENISLMRRIALLY